MKDHETRPIPVTNLLLDFENPRHDIVKNQRDAILTMLDNQNEKLLRLAEDIIEAGPNPSELLIVVPYSKDGDLFIVLEGNRRVTALKLLETPSILSKKAPKQLRQKLNVLSKRYRPDPIETLLCAILPNRESANRWIRLKHTGENQGVGVVSWGAKEVARFNERFGKKTASLQAVDFVKRNAIISSETREKLDTISITNLTRLLNDPSVRQLLGIEIVEGNIQTHLQKSEVIKGLTKILKDLAYKTINVNDIRSKKDRGNYVETFKHNEIPNQSKRTTKTWSLESDTEESEDKLAEKADDKKTKRSKPVFSKRKPLIPSNCVIRINDRRINNIYRELKALNLDDYPNAGAILLRVFFELSVDNCIDKNGLSIHPDSKLKKKVQAVTDHFRRTKILSRHQLKPINTSISNPNSLISIETLHAYVHNRHFYPKPNELKHAWDEMQTFMEKLWE